MGRDYNMRCPVQYVDIGTISGGTTRYCSPGSEYMGPCDKAEDFSKLSRKAMVRWSNQCQAYWPCIGCLRDYRELCPQEWARVGDELKCKPPATYSGACSGITDFTGYNKDMKQQWSAACGVFLALPGRCRSGRNASNVPNLEGCNFEKNRKWTSVKIHADFRLRSRSVGFG